MKDKGNTMFGGSFWRNAITQRQGRQAARPLIRQLLSLTTAAGLALATGVVSPPAAKAYTKTPFDPTSTIVVAEQGTGPAILAHETREDHYKDNVFRIIGAEAHANTAAAGGKIKNLKGTSAWAKGSTYVDFGPKDYALAVTTTDFYVDDPQHRGTVKLKLRIKAVGIVATAGSYADWTIALGSLAQPPFDVFYEATGTHEFFAPVLSQPYDLLIYAHSTLNNSSVCDSFGCHYTAESSTEIERTINFTITPGYKYLQLVASVIGNAAAVADPIIEVDPSNPDVVVTAYGADLPPTSEPLVGFTPEELAAQGLDPGPFLRLGFFDSAPAGNHPPVARCQNVTVPAATNSCAVASASVDNGSSDPDGTTPTVAQSPAGPYPVGTTQVTLTASDGSLSSQCTATVTVTDGQAPAITCPADQTVPATSSSGAVVNFTPSATDNCSTLMTACSPASGATFPLGTTATTCTATDGAGLQKSCNFNVTVNRTTSYSFTGFFPPVKNTPLVNRVKAGRTIPLKFSLGGNYGLNILAAGSPQSQQITCPITQLSDLPEEEEAVGGGSLIYNPRSDQYKYKWKTERGWEGTCRQVTLRLTDGTEHKANFKFK